MRNCCPGNPVYFEHQYEVLRREALSSHRGLDRGHGLALFLSQGMVAWMMVLSTLRPPRVASSSSELKPAISRRRPELTLGIRSDLRKIFAGMVLACTQELPHE